MDEEIEKRNEDNILHSGLRAWLKKINLLEYSGKFLENGYDDLDQLRSMTGEDLAEVTSDVGLVEKKGHLKRFYASVEKLKTAKKCAAALDCTESVTGIKIEYSIVSFNK